MDHDVRVDQVVLLTRTPKRSEPRQICPQDLYPFVVAMGAKINNVRRTPVRHGLRSIQSKEGKLGIKLNMQHIHFRKILNTGQMAKDKISCAGFYARRKPGANPEYSILFFLHTIHLCWQ